MAIQVSFCKVAGENGKKLLPDIVLSNPIYKFFLRISPIDVFIILQLSGNDFRVRPKGGKQ